jgi:hypothetical protein
MDKKDKPINTSKIIIAFIAIIISVLLITSYLDSKKAGSSNNPASELNADGNAVVAQPTEQQPTERSLKVANFAYEDSTADNRAEILKTWANGSNDSVLAVHNWAVYLDQDLQELVRLETLIEKIKAERSRPIYNEPPAQVIQQAPVVQQNTSPKHCTSNTIGNYTYTNCY